MPYTVVAAANCANAPTPFSLSNLAGPGPAGPTPAGRARAGGSLGQLYTGVAEVVNQNRNVSVVDGVLHDVLLGYGTAFYRFPPVPWGSGDTATAHNLVINPSFELAANVGSPDGDYLGAPATSQLNGASFLADSRTSVDGLHSLRLVAPNG